MDLQRFSYRTKMNYPLKPKQRKNPHLKSAWGFVIGVFAFVYILSIFHSTALFGVLSPVVSPVWRAKQYALNFITSHVGFFEGKQSLITENTNLKQKIEGVTALELERDALIKENESLRGITSSATQNDERARILTSPSQSAYDIVTAELEPNSNVAVGDAVFAENNIALGVVKDRKGNFVHIEYYSNPGVKTPAQLGQKATSIEIIGQGSGNFLFVAPRDFEVSQGDLVVLPRFATSIIGRVEAVESLRADSLKNIYISYPINIFTISFVRIHHAF